MSKPTTLGLIFICVVALHSVEAVTKKKKDRTNSCPYDKYCAACGDHKICSNCVFSYINRLGVCQVPRVVIPHCEYYSSAITCYRCMLGFYVTGDDKICEPIPVANCAVLVEGSTTQCAACDNFSLPNNLGQCVVTNVCPIDNCKVCGSATQCLRCREGFMVTVDNKCVAQTALNCLWGDGKKCRRCVDGYFHSKDKCVWSNVQQLIMSASNFPVVLALLLAVKMIA